MHIPRVLVISHMYPSHADPVDGIFIHRGVRALVERGNVEVMVVSSVPWAPRVLWGRPQWKKWADIQKTTSIDEVTTVRPAHVEIPFKHFWPYRGVSMALRLLPKLVALRQEFPFNIIHTHTVTPDGLTGIILGKWFQTPTVCSIRGSDVNSYPFRSKRYYAFSRRVLQKTDIVLANNRPILEKAGAIAGRDIRCRCIYNGIDQSLFFPEPDKRSLRVELGFPKDCTLIIFIGDFITSKGVLELCDAFIRLSCKERNVHLLMVGAGPLRPEVEARFGQAESQDSVTFTGRVPQKIAAALLRAADIFVLPSHSEGMPNALIEAMACGVASVVTPVGGVIEVVENGVNGLLIPVGNPERLRSAITQLLVDTKLRTTISRLSIIKIGNRFSWTRHAIEHKLLYQELLQ